MPGVGGRQFPYTQAGKRQAKRFSKSTGQPMQQGRGYGQGMDRRGGARTGMLSKMNRPSAGNSMGRPSGMSPLGGGRGRMGAGNRSKMLSNRRPSALNNKRRPAVGGLPRMGMNKSRRY
jgi:hypothetical protein